MYDNVPDIVNCFNQYFTSIPSLIHAQIPHNNNDFYENIPINEHSAYFYDATAIEVHDIIRSLKNKPSSTDNITTKILKSISLSVSDTIATLYNNCFRDASYPSYFKLAKVIPVFKRGSGSALEISNYRPISILHIINKVFEKLLSNRINKFLSQHNLLSPYQFGFTANKGTQNATLFLMNKILPSFTHKLYNLSVFIDFSKAFDTIIYERLLHKLHLYGFRGIINDFIRSYLTHRSQYVKIKDYSSNCLPVLSGVPQGSCLGPLLFNIYVNDLAFLPLKSTMIQFADDMVLTLTGIDLLVLSNESNADLDIVDNWCQANFLALNSRKTKAMIFSPLPITIYPIIKIHQNVVEFVDCYKYLGLEIDSKLKFIKHLANLKNKLARVVGISKSLSSLINLSTAKTIYYSLAYSHILYLIPIWGHSAITRINDLQIEQNKIVRNLFSHRFPGLNTNDLYVKLKILKINEIFELELGKLIFLTLNSNKYPNINEVLINLQWTHNHNTRKISTYRLPFARVLPDYNSFIFQGVKLWNNLPISVRSSNSVSQFVKEFTVELLDRYIV
jgi:hypothetical protein